MLPIVPAGSWSTLPTSLSPIISETLDKLKFTSMTPVQSQTIPLLLKSKDVVVEAVTGSGKSLAFVIPVIELLLRKSPKLKKNEIGAIILTPTRELAIQIYNLVYEFLPNSHSNYIPHTPTVTSTEEDQQRHRPISSPLSLGLYVGGSTSSLEDDLAYMREFGSHIVVGTPGRLAELLKRGAGRTGGTMISMKEFEILVIDEADRLLEVGYARDFDLILATVPKQRRTGLFSATMTNGIQDLVRTGLRNPVKVNVRVCNARTGESWRTPKSLHLGTLIVSANSKVCYLIQMIRKWVRVRTKAIVFFSTCAQVDFWYKVLSRILTSRKWPFFSLHGRQVDERRCAVYDQFVQSEMGVLLTTDLAARGLDIMNVDLVVQFDAPTVPEMYAHRAGRAGRNGKFGRSVLLLTANERTFIEFMAIRKVHISIVDSGDWGRCNPDESVGVDRIARDQGGDDDCRGANGEHPKQAKVGDMYLAEDAEMQVSNEMIDQVHTEIMALVQSDRDIMEKGICAFTSSIRAYSQHQLSYIFRMSQVDYLGLIQLHALVRIPNMPELKSLNESDLAALMAYEQGVNVNVDDIPYSDMTRELSRQRKLLLLNKTLATNNALLLRRRKKYLSEAWSEQKLKKQRRVIRREKNAAARSYAAAAAGGGRHSQILMQLGAKEEEDEKMVPKDNPVPSVAIDQQPDSEQLDWVAFKAESKNVYKPALRFEFRPSVSFGGASDDDDC